MCPYLWFRVLLKRPVMGCQKKNTAFQDNNENDILQIRLLFFHSREYKYSLAQSKTPPCGFIVEAKSDRLILEYSDFCSYCTLAAGFSLLLELNFNLVVSVNLPFFSIFHYCFIQSYRVAVSF